MSLGHAVSIAVDLGRPDLGLPGDRTFSMVVPTVRDLAFNSLRFAQCRRIPYVALSDAAFEIAPVVAMFAHRPTAAPLLLLGHSHGGIPSIVAGVLARQFKQVVSIAIGLISDPEDPFGPGSQADMGRIMRADRRRSPGWAAHGAGWTSVPQRARSADPREPSWPWRQSG